MIALTTRDGFILEMDGPFSRERVAIARTANEVAMGRLAPQPPNP